MQPTDEVWDDVWRRLILRARQMSPDEKFREGAQLFQKARRIARVCIRDEYPDADEARVEEILDERLSLLRRLEASNVTIRDPFFALFT